MARSATQRTRIAAFDALRGGAAFTVAFQHRTETLWRSYARVTTEYFRPGQLAVVLFFLASGCLIPSAVQRHRSAARFLTNRALRLLPVYLIAVIAVVSLHYSVGVYPLPRAYVRVPVSATLANVSMLAPMVQQPLAIGAAWTLAFEIVFYVLASLLVTPQRDANACPAVAFACLSSGLALLAGCGGRLPIPPVPILILIAASWPRGGRAPRLTRLVVAGLLLAPLPWLPNCYVYYGDSLNALYLSVFFLGAAMTESARSPRTGCRAYALVGMSSVTVCIVSASDGQPGRIPTFLCAYAIFTWCLMARRATYPRGLLRLGTISYPLYVIHPLVFALLGNTLFGVRPLPVVLTGQLIVVVAIAAVVHVVVERPMMRIGRALKPTREAPARPLDAAVLASWPPRPRSYRFRRHGLPAHAQRLDAESTSS
jgi:peptidoglycan/LPS O-acetylase OafA/YrhL